MKLYIITNNINGRLYAGKSEKTGEAYDKYMGSGTVLRRAYTKYGVENFTKRTLKLEIDNTDNLNRLERKLIRRLRYKFGRRMYNIHEGGNGGYLCMYMEDRTWVNERISVGKKQQYANGQTTGQLEGRKKQSATLKQTNILNYDRVIKHQIKRGASQTKRVKESGLTEKEKKRNIRVAKRNTLYVTYMLSYPDGRHITETSKVKDFIAKYKTESTVISAARQKGSFTFNRRTSRTSHPFPECTKLTFISEIDGLGVLDI